MSAHADTIRTALGVIHTTAYNSGSFDTIDDAVADAADALDALVAENEQLQRDLDKMTDDRDFRERHHTAEYLLRVAAESIVHTLTNALRDIYESPGPPHYVQARIRKVIGFKSMEAFPALGSTGTAAEGVATEMTAATPPSFRSPEQEQGKA